jgi:DNA-binding PadR family transcriptional regulator
MLPNVSEEGRKEISRALAELDELQTWIDPDRQEITPEIAEKRRLETRKKIHNIMDFLVGNK